MGKIYKKSKRHLDFDFGPTLPPPPSPPLEKPCSPTVNQFLSCNVFVAGLSSVYTRAAWLLPRGWDWLDVPSKVSRLQIWNVKLPLWSCFWKNPWKMSLCPGVRQWKLTTLTNLQAARVQICQLKLAGKGGPAILIEHLTSEIGNCQ